MEMPVGFSTQGHTVYHLCCARLGPAHGSALVGAAFDGTVVCYTAAGKLLWKNRSSNAFPLDLAVADITGDGFDETLVAAADGTLYAIDHRGILLWTFHREPPLLQVCVVQNSSARPLILTGGIERKLYALSTQGQVVHTVESPFVIRHIRAGNILGDSRELAAVVTAKNDKSRFMLHLYDPNGLTPIWDEPVALTTVNPTVGTKYYVPWAGNKVAPPSMLIYDINQDGRDEIILSNHFAKKGVFDVYDHQGQKVMASSNRGIRGQAYRMNLLSHVQVGRSKEHRIMGLFGNQIVLYDLAGKVVKLLDCRTALTCSAFDARSQTLYLGSSVSGGDGIYRLSLMDCEWEHAYRDLEPVGKLARIEKNLEILAQQVEDFKRPQYQRVPGETLVVTGKSAEEIDRLFLKGMDYRHLRFAQFNLLTEDYDRDGLEGIWKTKRETRHKYNYSADEIIAFATEREAKREPFVLWAGHGNDPFYMQLSTIEGILKAAPIMAKALVFPEMERTDEDMAYAVRAHILPIAELCRQHGTAKIVLRNKNIFWNGSCYLKLWSDLLLKGDYRDIFVPSMEETNGRTQALSLSGRMGLWLTYAFDRLSGRAVTDNANFSRFWEWGAQQTQSHLLRSMALRASLGADMFLVNIYQGDQRDMIPFYRMIEKGVIAIPRREELLSVADVCLGMKSPSPAFLKHGKNGHAMNLYEPGGTPAVFDRMDCFWGAAPTADHDFTRYAMSSQRRMLNFLPTYPYGLIASIPADAKLDSYSHFRSMMVTDGECFYDENGGAVSAPNYKTIALEKLKDAASRLPVRVEGDLAWTVVRLDETHVRVILIDSGYTDPDDRDAKIILQHLEGTACRDMLRNETLAIRQGTIALTVPAGVLRIVDITHLAL